jgi:hypothetical protein
LKSGGTAFDWFLLALVRGRQRRRDEARPWFVRAVDWMEKNRPRDVLLRGLRTEAAGLLGEVDRTATTPEGRTSEPTAHP